MRNRPHRSAVQHNAHRSHVDVHVIAYLHRTAPWSAGAALEWTEAWPKGRLGVADAACYAQAVNRQNVGARAEARPPHHPRVGRHSSQAFRAAAERPASHHRVIAMPLFSPSAHARSVCRTANDRGTVRVWGLGCVAVSVFRAVQIKNTAGEPGANPHETMLVHGTDTRFTLSSHRRTSSSQPNRLTDARAPVPPA